MNQVEIPQPPVATDEILRIRQRLQEVGYALSSDMALGMSPQQHKSFDNKFFTDQLLGPELTALSSLLPHRMRARDVIVYQRLEDDLALEESPFITLREIPHANIPAREYRRIFTLQDAEMIHWIKTLLSMVPVNEQQATGKLSMDFLRTFQQATAFRHQDHEQFVIIYVVARNTNGAVTSIHPIADPDQTEIAVALQPGEYFIFRDRDFMHDVTPLEPRYEGDKQYRDAIVALVRYPESES